METNTNKSLREHAAIKVLMYHSLVSETSDSSYDPFSVSVNNFKRQLALLDFLNFTTITFTDYDLYRQGKLTLPKKPIILTFDDGHRNTYDLALPMLRELNMRAVLFAVGNRKLANANWDKCSNLAYPLMTDEQILVAESDVFEIGAHTMSHPKLTEIDRLDELWDEIYSSKKSIERLIKKEVISFAYPYGCVNDRVKSVVKEAGFKYACGVYTGPPVYGRDIYDIRRLSVKYNTSILKFLLMLHTPYEYVEWLYTKFRDRSKQDLTADSVVRERVPVDTFKPVGKRNFEIEEI
ncbi:polysaccharide deacetylase family protein [Fodinibius sp. AD559]|uniref:polysaccharide deacetylase family protein n=1 Tax=Fodinibius sp. AD559 TaxID=3424179 RepID=UPI004046E37F